MEGIDIDALRRLNIDVVMENGGVSIVSKNFKTIHKVNPQMLRRQKIAKDKKEV